MIQVVRKIPYYRSFRTFGWPVQLPLNLTVSPSFRCNSQCKTCNVYEKNSFELSIEEWRKIFLELGQVPFWVTISGGEPFLNKWLPDLTCLLYDTCKPAIINIPTNGLLIDRIPDYVNRIVAHCRRASVVVNVSIDAIGQLNDEIRGVPGAYNKAVSTFKSLKSLKLPNLSVGIHTVISRYNVDLIPQIYTTLIALNPDSYITEIAEERVELGTIGVDITPDQQRYEKVADYLIARLKKERFKRLGKVTRIFRIEYYEMVKRILRERRQVVPCYSGFASAHIAPDGNVWMCCIKAESIGDLKTVNYSFRDLWLGEKAERMRAKIKAGSCHCPLANAAYTNMLHNGGSLFRVSRNLLVGK